MKIDTNEYIPFKQAVKLSGRHDSAFQYNVLVGKIQTIDPWNGHRLYRVKDVLKLVKTDA